MARKGQPAVSVPEGFFLANDEENRGISVGLYKAVTFDEASDYRNGLQERLQYGIGSAIYMADIVPGGTYGFGNGTVTRPSIAFQNEVDTGRYLVASGSMGESIDGVNVATWNSSGLRLANLTSGRVLFASTSGQIDDDGAFLWDDTNKRLMIGGVSPDSKVEIVSTTSQLYLTHTEGSINTLLHTDSSGIFRIVPSGGAILETQAIAGTMYLELDNSTAGNTSAHARFTARTRATGGNPELFLVVDGTNSWQVRIDNSDSDKFKVVHAAASDRLVIDTSGNVFISTLTSGRVTFATTSGQLTDDAGFTYSSSDDQITLAASHATTTPQIILSQASTGDTALRWAQGTAHSYIAGIDNSDADQWKLSYAASATAVLGTNDYLKIATDGTAAHIALVNADYNILALTNDRNTANDIYGIRFGDTFAGRARIAAINLNTGTSAGVLAFYTSSGVFDMTERVRIESGGNVGINTTGPDRRLDILDASNPQLRLTYTDGSVYTDLQTNSSGNTLFSNSGTTVNYTVSNTSTTPMWEAIQNSTGDAAYRAAIGITNSFAWGIDNSDSDSWKLSYANSGSAVLGTNDYLKITTSGQVDISQYLRIGSAPASVGDLRLSNDIGLIEISDPAAPAANEGRLYVKDNGAGKTQLVVRFNTGAVQVIATEP